MATEIEGFIAQNCQWDKLPANARKLLGNTKKEYDKQVIEYSIKTQRQYMGNLVQQVVGDPKLYYKDLVAHSRSHLMMFPYHLSELVVRGLRITPFQYYIDILSDIMLAEKSYDSLPNFTAADCLRLLGIGRNQYIDLMNHWRSGRKLFRRRNVREILPALPREITIDKWWMVKPGCITEDDVKIVGDKERETIDLLIDGGPQRAGCLCKEVVHSLYSKGLVYLHVPIENNDCLTVPPLEGFVMNRVLGDYLENLLYKIFVSMDEHTCVTELAEILEIDLDLVKMAVSLFCRLGFAQLKIITDTPAPIDSSWGTTDFSGPKNTILSPTSEDLLLLELDSTLDETNFDETGIGASAIEGDLTPTDEHFEVLGIHSSDAPKKRIAFLYDSTLTAFLMMGNLSPGLKSHAVTMFEIGKLLDESLDSLITELSRIQSSDSEGEAQRYFEHALTLKTTIGFLRNNPNLLNGSTSNPSNQQDTSHALDLIRWESLSNLDPATTGRLLNKNYQFLVSMAPLCYEIPRVEGQKLPHFGPAIPEINSVWFKLFLYSLTNSGLPSLLLPRGERLKRLPRKFSLYEKFLVFPWGHDSTVVPLSNLFFTINEALMHSPVFIQAYGWYHDVYVQHVPLPLDPTSVWANHPALSVLNKTLDFQHCFGYIKMISFVYGEAYEDSTSRHSTVLRATEIQTGVPQLFSTDLCVIESPRKLRGGSLYDSKTSDDGFDKLENNSSNSTNDFLSSSLNKWMLLECNFGLPLFDANLNREISRRIVSHKLFSAPSVEKFMCSSANMIDLLQEFTNEWKAERNSFVLADRRQLNENASCLPLPTRPILFMDGKLSFWNGS